MLADLIIEVKENCQRATLLVGELFPCPHAYVIHLWKKNDTHQSLN